MAVITKEMKIAEALSYGDADKMAEVLYSFGMHCLHCALAHGETLEQAAATHNVDVDEMVAKLNEVAEG
ncbi:MAG: DUF1858 domain-containing protein [Christensenellales bacterium]